MGVWTGKNLGFTGYGHFLPGPPVPIDQRPVVRHRGIKRAALEKLGVRSLHLSAPDVSASDLAVQAGRMALADAAVAPADLNLVVVANSTQRLLVPELGPKLAVDIGAHTALGFDICGGCAGFVHAVQTAAALMDVNRWHTALVVATDQFSRRVAVGSPDSLVAGDAAGAVVLQRGVFDGRGLIDSVLHSDGTQADVFVAHPSGTSVRYESERLFDLAVDTQLKVVDELLARNGLSLFDVDVFIPHPGAQRVINDLTVRTGIDPDKVAAAYAETGNTVSAMIPTALSMRHSAGKVPPGSLVLATTAGAGWFGGGLLFVT
jgi:3-oxoacyl-[acyl-carrier-protein] synthase III